jgi:hypothetical protein
MNVTVNGWTHDPVEQAWTARVAEDRWLIMRSDIDDPPTFRPETCTDAYVTSPGR